MTQFFKLLTLHKSNITQQLLSLVTSLAQNLKYLIRSCLAASQTLVTKIHKNTHKKLNTLQEQTFGIQNAIPQFLDELSELEKKRVWIAGRYWFKDPPSTTILEDLTTSCSQCHNTINNDDCFQSDQLQWHVSCFRCSKCTCQLHLNNAVLVSGVLYCSNCQQQSDSSFTLSYSYQQNLHHLKIYLSKISSYPEPPKTKRQRSILRILSTTQKKTVIDHNTSDTTLAEPTKINQLIKRTFSTTKPTNIQKLFENKPIHEKYMTSFTCSQDYILRHAAVIQIHTELSDHFTLDELVSFMNHKKKAWGKLWGHLRSPPCTKTFGMPLPLVAQRDTHQDNIDYNQTTPALNACFSDHNAVIPIFIKSCILMILRSGKKKKINYKSPLFNITNRYVD